MDLADKILVCIIFLGVCAAGYLIYDEMTVELPRQKSYCETNNMEFVKIDHTWFCERKDGSLIRIPRN